MQSQPIIQSTPEYWIIKIPKTSRLTPVASRAQKESKTPIFEKTSKPKSNTKKILLKIREKFQTEFPNLKPVKTGKNIDAILAKVAFKG